MYNSESKEIAKPSELLNSIKAIMTVLQSIENYGNVLFLCHCLSIENCCIGSFSVVAILAGGVSYMHLLHDYRY